MKNRKVNVKVFQTALRLSLPVLGGYWFLGITYGLLASDLGYSLWIPLSMAMLIYSGSVEFVALTLLLGTFNPLAAFVMACMVGSRHLFYGISMLDVYSGAGWRKPLLIYWLTDETFAVNFSNRQLMMKTGNAYGCYLWVSVLHYIYWITGTIMGYLMGTAMSPSLLQCLEGLEFVVTAMFVAIFMDDYLQHPSTRKSSWLGIVAAGACLLLFGSSNFLIPTMGCILFTLLIIYKNQHS